jgi:serine/threonine protein kinase
MAPEVIKGDKYNNKVDIWALGCIIYELLTLNICFESKGLYGIIDKIVNKPHGKIDTKKYSDKWQNIIDLLLKKDYKERPDINEVYNLIINLGNELSIKRHDFKNNKFLDLVISNNKNSNEKKIEIISKEKSIKLEKENIDYIYLTCKKNKFNYLFIFIFSFNNWKY